MSKIIIQRISVSWSKKSRGGKMASMRSFVPSKLRIPSIESNQPVFINCLYFSENNLFFSPIRDESRSEDLVSNIDIDDVSVRYEDGRVSAVYQWRDGAPARCYYDEFGNRVPKVYKIKIEKGGWGQIRYNGRFSEQETGNWWYEMHTVNIAYQEDWCGNVFLAKKPICKCELMARLW